MAEKQSPRPDLPIASLLDAFGTNLEFSRDLAQFTSFRTGGRARLFVSTETAREAIRAIKAARRLDIPYFVMGGGSNLLVSDDGFDGLVIKASFRGLKLHGKTVIEAGAGEDLADLVDFATSNSLTGLEFAAGIWGGVGGAIYGNAGAFGGDVGSIVTQITFIDNDLSIRREGPEYGRFAYRDSRFKTTHEIIVGARFQLQKGDQTKIQARVDEILELRRTKHPEDLPSAGCFFKNIPDPTQEHGKLAAGRLLEEVGAKEMHIGGAKVFEKHANIIVNSGGATSKDIRKLADTLKEKVFERFGIRLQEEVQQLGDI
ncbi:MAG: UDP-N-acetylmuramate dehydrogenase [candidate division Zixibacteria bacterium]|nr:UDP-N-acetylmuramate dehydrogenase [candidate division Zixibacteria bacterium]